MVVAMGDRARELGVSPSRSRVGEFWAERGDSGGGTDAFGAKFGRSRGGNGEAEVVGRMARNLVEQGVEMADAGSLHSRRRLLTAMSEDSLPMARLPERIGSETASAERAESRIMVPRTRGKNLLLLIGSFPFCHGSSIRAS